MELVSRRFSREEKKKKMKNTGEKERLKNLILLKSDA